MLYFDHGLQLDGVSSKLADAVGQLLHGHAVLVVLPTERLLVQVDLLQVEGLGCTETIQVNGIVFHSSMEHRCSERASIR